MIRDRVGFIDYRRVRLEVKISSYETVLGRMLKELAFIKLSYAHDVLSSIMTYFMCTVFNVIFCQWLLCGLRFTFTLSNNKLNINLVSDLFGHSYLSNCFMN